MTTDADRHLSGHAQALAGLDTARLDAWGRHLARLLTHGGRLLIAGNGGSAAQAQHLSAELLGRFRLDRQPLPALALHTDTSTLTALSNDYGYEQSFARQVQAHGRPGDVLLVLTTSGTSPNILAALTQARALDMTTWALTGPAPNPTATGCDEALTLNGSTANVQEAHLVAVHVLCSAIDDNLPIGKLAVDADGADVLGGRAPAGAGSAHVVVLGDALLDETLDGDVSRVSPEAPVPVVSRPRQRYTPGGAGLAALLAVGDGRSVTLVTALSDDGAAATLLRLLDAAGVAVINLGTPAPTPVKTRIRSRRQTMLMVDHADPAAAPPALTGAARAALEDASAILVSDYGRGVTGHPETRRVLTELARSIPLVWDPHPRGALPVPGVTVVTPNALEAAHFTGTDPNTRPSPTDLAADVAAAEALLGLWGARYVALTRGGDGVVLVGGTGGTPMVIPAPPVAGLDTCGAGDCLAADVTAQLAAGALPTTATVHAVHAAAAFVAKRPRESTELTSDTVDVLHRVAQLRAAGARIVATGGCFDLLHRGHITMLQQARTLGDVLVVCINSDAGVTRLKGQPRPLVPAQDRAAILQALTCVDAVLVFDEDTPEQILAQLRPDVFVKGGDYALIDLPERAAVEAHGGSVVLAPYLDGRSSTALVNRAAGGATASSPRPLAPALPP